MYLTVETILTASAVLGAIAGFITMAWKLFIWIEHQKEQDAEIVKLKKMVDDLSDHHEKDLAAVRDEQTLIVYGLLACLKGLKELGCNNTVTDTIARIEKHINKKAHE